MNAADLLTGPCGSAVAVVRPCPRGNAAPTCDCDSPLTPAANPGDVLAGFDWSRREESEGIIFERSSKPPAAVTVHEGATGPEIWLDADEVLTVEVAHELAIALLEAVALAGHSSA